MTQKQIEELVNNILGTIEREREREIVSRRYGIFDRKETLEQIGELLGHYPGNVSGNSKNPLCHACGLTPRQGSYLA